MCHIRSSTANQTVIHCFISLAMTIISTRNPRNNRIKYVSDGAASVYYEYDFNLTVEYHFFATSHGKSPCDEICVTAKREAANASSRPAITNQILTPEQIFL